jgi:hypothetical protein
LKYNSYSNAVSIQSDDLSSLIDKESSGSTYLSLKRRRLLESKSFEADNEANDCIEVEIDEIELVHVTKKQNGDF